MQYVRVDPAGLALISYWTTYESSPCYGQCRFARKTEVGHMVELMALLWD